LFSFFGILANQLGALSANLHGPLLAMVGKHLCNANLLVALRNADFLS
jgi:hypothetical protein